MPNVFGNNHSRLLFILYILNGISLLTSEGNIQIINKARFPYGGPFMGLFLAIAFPIDLPEYNVFVSVNLEANYNLPQNETTYEYPPIVDVRSFIDRTYAFNAIENKLKAHGYPGKSCLLRTICEAAEYSMEHNGVLADILHIILTPSASQSEGLLEYEEAEMYGKEKLHCKKYTKKCSVSLLKLISTLNDVIY